MKIHDVFDFLNNLCNSFLSIGNWLNTPLIQLGDFYFSPIMLFTFSGLTAFIAVAVIKWAVS